MLFKKYGKKHKRNLVILSAVVVFFLTARFFNLLPTFFSERKLIYFLILVSILVLKISYRYVALAGSLLILMISFFALLGKMNVVGKLAVYSWGIFIFALFLLFIEIWIKRK